MAVSCLTILAFLYFEARAETSFAEILFTAVTHFRIEANSESFFALSWFAA